MKRKSDFVIWREEDILICYKITYHNIGITATQKMLTKTLIQNLNDSEMIRIFLEFVQAFHLNYEKVDKEISYKCHEATWILSTTKATGYGRTQPEAYKHALRNLLEIIVEDPIYMDFFNNILHPQKKNTNSHSLTNSVNPLKNSNSMQKEGRKDLKTETY